MSEGSSAHVPLYPLLGGVHSLICMVLVDPAFSKVKCHAGLLADCNTIQPQTLLSHQSKNWFSFSRMSFSFRQGVAHYLEEYLVGTTGGDGCICSANVCHPPRVVQLRARAVWVQSDSAALDTFPSPWQMPETNQLQRRESLLLFNFLDFNLQLALTPLARQYLTGQSRLLISLQPESNIPFQTKALHCDKQPPNNKGIENFVVMKQVEKWKWSHDFIFSFGLIQNHFLIKELPRPFRTKLCSFPWCGNTTH